MLVLKCFILDQASSSPLILVSCLCQTSGGDALTLKKFCAEGGVLLGSSLPLSFFDRLHWSFQSLDRFENCFAVLVNALMSSVALLVGAEGILVSLVCLMDVSMH